MEEVDLTDCLIMRRSPNFKEPVFAGIDAVGELLGDPKCGLASLRIGGNNLGGSGCKRLANGIAAAFAKLNAKKNRYLEEREAMLGKLDDDDDDAGDDDATSKIFFIAGDGVSVAQAEAAQAAHEQAQRTAAEAEKKVAAYKATGRKLTAAEAKKARIEAKKARAAERRAKVGACTQRS